MTTIKGVITNENYTTYLYSATNKLVADEPIGIGGKDKGFAPGELLASSLAACTCITLRMYAQRKKFKLESVEVTISVEKDEAKNSTQIQRHIQLIGNLTIEEKERLLTIANHCPIHTLLSNPIHIQTKLL